VVKKRTLYLKICEQCGEIFFGEKKNEYCSKKCSKTGKVFTKESKKKMSEAQKGNKSSSWKGGYRSKGIATYDTYAHQLEWCEEVRRNEIDPNILEVKCFKCGKWYIPSYDGVSNRLQHLKGNYENEHRFYCSKGCKNSCSIYNKSINSVIKQDAVRAGRLPWLELTREVQLELREMVLERDKNQCVKCESTNDLQCHHIYPVSTNPIESTDVDNCITLCKECHIEVHKKDGCKYSQLRMEMC